MAHLSEGADLGVAYEAQAVNFAVAAPEVFANQTDVAVPAITIAQTGETVPTEAERLADAREIAANHLPVPIGVPLSKAVKIVDAAVAPIITDRGSREVFTDEFYERALHMRRARGRGSR